MNELVVVGVLLALVAIRVGVVCAGVMLLVRPVRACPACFRRTAPVRKPWLRFVGRRLEWRWCASCGWEGPARRVAEPEPAGISGGRPRSAPRE